MNIELKNCRNIDSAVIAITEKKLNKKYAINGTGKSTIAKAIDLKSKNGSLDELLAFKYIGKAEKAIPEVNGLEGVSNTLIFNEDYIDQFAFKQEELISNSFDIFVKTPDYEAHMNKIELLLAGIKTAFEQDEVLNKIIADLTSFVDSFGKAASGYSAAGALAKGIGNGNKVEHIPVELQEYSDFIKSVKKVPWLGWQLKGHEFMDISQKCPFCTSNVEEKKNTITKIKDNYDTKAIEHLNSVLAIIEKLSYYFSNETNIRFSELSKKSDKLSKEEIEYLLQVKQQAILLRDKLIAIKGLSFFGLKDVEKVVERIEEYKIKISFLPYFNSEHTAEIITSIDASLDSALSQAGLLQGEVKQQKITIENTIREHSTQINEFLISAGYKYQVSIEFVDNEYRMKLRHIDYDKPIENGSQYLSYGEKNALAIVLFMYEALSKKADLIILDDPISSFDKNKKYAIIDMLFGSGKGLINKTVILLTHDFEPIIDLMYALYTQFNNKVVASFLEIDNGVITEKTIERDDIKTFTEICDVNIEQASVDITKLIHLRRLYEINNNKGIEYELLSNLFHKRENPYRRVEGQITPLTEEEIINASDEIKAKVDGFRYTDMLNRVNDDAFIFELYKNSISNFEKLELYRILTGEAIGDNVLRKYINETFHIENDYVMQLNPIKYQVIPSFIIDQCNKELGLT